MAMRSSLEVRQRGSSVVDAIISRIDLLCPCSTVGVPIPIKSERVFANLLDAAVTPWHEKIAKDLTANRYRRYRYCTSHMYEYVATVVRYRG